MRPISALLLTPLLLVVASCSQGGLSTLPAPEGQQHMFPLPPPDVALLGQWDLLINPATLTAEVVPGREATALGDSYWLNATGFLKGSPCGECLGVEGLSFNGDGQVVVTFRVRHPFQPGNPQLPISGANRLDLHVFDAQLLILGDKGNVSIPAGGGPASLPAGLVVAPAGYSGLLTSVAQQVRPDLTATIFPYVTIGEDRTTGNWASSNPNGFADLTQPTGFNIFPMGADRLTPVTLNLASGEPEVRLSVFFTAAYGQSAANRGFRMDPKYYLPEFNAKAPWRVDMQIPDSTNLLEAGNLSSTAEIQVQVYDWQAGAAVDPTLGNLGAVRAASEVASVELFVPGVLTSSQTLTPTGGTGFPDNPLQYNTLITNQAGAGEGTYYAAVRVTDTRPSGTNTGGATDGLSSIKGTTIDPVTISQFSTWQILPLEVEGLTRQLLSITIAPTTRQIIAQGTGEAVTFTATGTFDTPPLTEDISGTVTWHSSATDVGTFSGPVLTGVGMGTTQVHATQGSVTSLDTNPATVVIVKPVQFSTIAGFGYEIDAHQGTGEFYILRSSPNRVLVYNDDAVFQRQWTITDYVSFVRGITIDEAANRVYTGSGQPGESINIVVFDPNGTRITGYAPGSAALTWHYQGIVILDNGELWHRPFVPQTTWQYDKTTGAILSTWASAPFVNSVYDSDNWGNLLVHSNPGGRGSGRAIAITDPNAQQTLATGSILPIPAGQSQNTVIAVDRDGYIHLGWSITAPLTNPIIEVYEYLPPSTIAGPLYTYAPTSTGNASNGIAVSRPNNVVAINHGFPSMTSFFH